MSLKPFLHPTSIAVVGASIGSANLGSIILKNIQDSGFSGDLFGINPKYSGQEESGVRFFGSVSDVETAIDLVMIVVPARFVYGVAQDCVHNGSKSIIVISAGFGEVGNHEQEKQLIDLCKQNNIRLLGPNCLGAILPAASVNASFADTYPRKGNVCFLSQSGAFCSAVLDWAEKKDIGFSHVISLGNKADISEVDLLEALKDDTDVDMFVLYLESNVQGRKFLELIRSITPTKPVVILEPGRSKKAAAVSASHTGSLAPNARVMETVYAQAGALQVFRMRDMFGIIEMYTKFPHKRFGKNLAIITNAGGVGVLSTDLSETADLTLEQPSPETKKKLQNALPEAAGLQNPIDIIGDARADRYEQALEIISDDSSVDQILILLTPQKTTEVEATARIIAKKQQETDKNIVASFIGGSQVQSGIEILEDAGVMHFAFPSDALQIMGLLSKQIKKQKTKKVRKPETNKEKENLRNEIKKLQSKGEKVLSQDKVDTILDAYEIDRPKSGNFTAKAKAKNFFEKDLRKSPCVMKISSPDALHKTEFKGVFLGIDTIEKFDHAWDQLESTIQTYHLKSASIQIQEHIPHKAQTIIGMNTDPNFGKILIFGSGGIYTEILQDTTIGQIPIEDPGAFIDQTKISKILHGARGEKALAVSKLIETLEKIQQLVIDIPEINSIDANPVLINENRSVCVDFKILL